MGETFYTALGVGADADAEAIRTAYRTQVKERHPDVSDDPDAPREFKRLTTARDVLTDEDERARYDRLGHATYVTRHLETNAWTVEDGADRGGSDSDAGARSRERSGGSAGAGRHRRSNTGGYDRSAWLGEDWDGPRDRRRRERDQRRRRHTAPGWSRSGSSDDDEDVGVGDSGTDREGVDPTDSGRSDGTPGDRSTGSGGTRDRRRGDSTGSRSKPDGQSAPGTSSSARSGRTRDRTRGTGGRTRETGDRSDTTRTAGAGSGTGPRGAGHRRGQPATGAAQRSPTATAGTGDTWQDASATYQYSPSAPRDRSRSLLRTFRRGVRAVMPWLLVHVVLFVGAVAMAWYMYVGTAAVSSASIPAVLFGLVLIGLVLLLSVLHMVSMVYT